MPSYMALAVIALAASTLSPALSAPVQEIREQALSHHELVKGKRRISLLSMEKLKNINFKKKLKEFVVSSVIGGLATEAGTDIYNDASKHHGNSTNPASTNGNGTFTYGNSSIPLTTGNETNPTNLVTPNGIPMYNNPTGSNPTNLVTTNGISMYNNPTNPPITNEISSTNPVSNNSIARAIDEGDERALGHGPPVNVFARFISGVNNQNRHTSFHLSRADLGEALSLLGRMLDELD